MKKKKPPAPTPPPKAKRGIRSTMCPHRVPPEAFCKRCGS